MDQQGRPRSSAFRTFVLPQLAALLSTVGYRASGARFTKEAGTATLVIEPQKSRDSTSSTTRFTLNVGVSFREVQEALSSGPSARSVDLGACQVQRRVGDLMTPPRDLWWEVDGETVGGVLDNVNDLLTRVVLPYLTLLSDPHQLLALWRSGVGTGLTRIDGLVAQAALEAIHGSKAAGRAALQEALELKQRRGLAVPDVSRLPWKLAEWRNAPANRFMTLCLHAA